MTVATPRRGGALRRAAPRLSLAALAALAAALSVGGSVPCVPAFVLTVRVEPAS